MKTWMLALALCLSATVAHAQVPPVVNPGGVEFTPSIDNDVIANGVAKVTRYTLQIAAQATPAVVLKTVDLGKPAVVNGKITYTGLDPVTSTLLAGNYVAVVLTEGPGGSTPSVASDPFTVAPKVPAAAGKPVWKQ